MRSRPGAPKSHPTPSQDVHNSQKNNGFSRRYRPGASGDASVFLFGGRGRPQARRREATRSEIQASTSDSNPRDAALRNLDRLGRAVLAHVSMDCAAAEAVPRLDLIKADRHCHRDAGRFGGNNASQRERDVLRASVSSRFAGDSKFAAHNGVRKPRRMTRNGCEPFTKANSAKSNDKPAHRAVIGKRQSQRSLLDDRSITVWREPRHAPRRWDFRREFHIATRHAEARFRSPPRLSVCRDRRRVRSPSRRIPRMLSTPARCIQAAEPVYQVQPPRPTCGGMA